MSKKVTITTATATTEKSKASKAAALLSSTDDEDLVTIFDDLNDDELCSICFTNPHTYTCPSCKCMVCDVCLKEYILKYSNLTPHCMQCQSELPFLVICKALGRHGVKHFFERSGVLRFELEKQQIPDCLECCDSLNALRLISSLPSYLKSILISAATTSRYSFSPTDGNISAMREALDEIAFKYRIDVLNALSNTLQKLRRASTQKSISTSPQPTNNSATIATATTATTTAPRKMKPTKKGESKIKSVRIIKKNNKALWDNVFSIVSVAENKTEINTFDYCTYELWTSFTYESDKMQFPSLSKITPIMRKQLEKVYSTITDAPFLAASFAVLISNFVSSLSVSSRSFSSRGVTFPR